MIQDLTRMDLVRLIRGCEPGMEHIGMLQQHGLGVYVGGMDDHWEWAGKESVRWLDVSEEDLWKLYTIITGDDRDEYAPSQVYVVTDRAEDETVQAVFSDKATAERYKDAEGVNTWVIEAFDLNPYFVEQERVWESSLLSLTMEMELRPSRDRRDRVGYVTRHGAWLLTWFLAKNRTEAMAKANDVFRLVAQGREQGKFRYLNEKVYLPGRKFPDIKEYPFYDVASGKIVMADYAAVLLPESEALLPDGTPNPDLFILLDRHFV